MAAAVNLPLALERAIAQRAVESRQSQVAERVHETQVYLAWVLAKACEMIPPLLAQCLRQDVLHGQIAELKVDLLRMPVALLEPLENEPPLLAAAAEVERAHTDCLAKLAVAGPVAALSRQFLTQRLREARVLRQVLDELDEQPVQRV